MRNEEVIRAWKNPAFRATLAGTDTAMFAHPAGLVALTDNDLDAVSGAGGSNCSGGGSKSGKDKSAKAKSSKSGKAKSGKGGCH